MTAEGLVVCTTDYLVSGDEADRVLTRAGYRTRHAAPAGRPGDDVVERLEGAVGALVGHEPLGRDELRLLSDLRVVVRTGVGYDSIDVSAATELGIVVSNLPGINAVAVAEYTFGLLLSAGRRLPALLAGVEAGRWPRDDGRELRGSVLGVIGHGPAAREVIRLAAAFGMRVLCTTSHPPRDAGGVARFVALDELLADADHVSVHTALTDATRGMLDAAAFARMKPGAVLVNTARGGLVDEEALLAAVESGHLAGAELDVAHEEPLPLDSPLRRHPSIHVYSHMAGQTAQARSAAGVVGAREVVDALAGQPRSSVNAHRIVAPR